MRADEVRVQAIMGARGFPRSTGSEARLILVVTPAAPSLMQLVVAGQLVATLSAYWTNGAPFTGTYRFVSPNNDHGGDYEITNGNQLTVTSSGATNINALSSLPTVEDVTIEAVQ